MQPILAHLSAGNGDAGDGLHPLQTGYGADGQHHAAWGVQLSVRIDVDKACLIGYHVSPSTRQDASDSSPECRSGNGAVLDTDEHTVALRLPLLCANVHRGSASGRGPRSCTVAIVMPARAVMLEAQGMSLGQTVPVPQKVEGVWVLEFGSEKDLKTVLDTLQAAGCIMDCVEERYDIGQALGYGSTAKVCIAEDQRTGEFVAVKITTKVASAAERDRGLTREAYVLRSVRHPNVLQFRGIYEFIEERTGHRLSAMVTEFLSGGELFEEVKRNGPMQADRALRVAFQLFSAVAYLHPRGIIHRDIKTENVILNGVNDEIKLVDFGLATPEWDTAAMAVRCGSPGYIAPEVLRKENYGCKVDCFSLGVLVYIMLVGYGPFRGRSLKETLWLNLKCDVSYAEFSQLPAEAKDFTAALLTGSPDKRPSAEQCLNHPWLKAQTEASTVLETRTAQRTFSKELACEDIFRPLRFADSLSLPGDSPRFSSKSRVDPTMTCSEFSLEAPENLSDSEEFRCVGMLRTLTPLWADVQKSLADLHAKGQLPFQHPDRFSAFFSREMKQTYGADDIERKTAYFYRDIKRGLAETADRVPPSEPDSQRNSAYFMADTFSQKENTDNTFMEGYSSGSEYDICLAEEEMSQNVMMVSGRRLAGESLGACRQVPVDRNSFNRGPINRAFIGTGLEGGAAVRRQSAHCESLGAGMALDGAAAAPLQLPIYRDSFDAGYPGDTLDGTNASRQTLMDRASFTTNVSADGIVSGSPPTDEDNETLQQLLGGDDSGNRDALTPTRPSATSFVTLS